MARLDKSQMKRRVTMACERFLKNDGYLLERDANERSITHKFAEHLQSEFRHWHVDCEYNRDEHRTKQLVLPRRESFPEEDGHARTVFPDIIVHRRGTRDNLLVIEAKKSSNPDGDDWDREKLTEFKTQLGYRFALFVRFLTREGHGEPELEWI